MDLAFINQFSLFLSLSTFVSYLMHSLGLPLHCVQLRYGKFQDCGLGMYFKDKEEPHACK